ncbi:MAG: molybdate ABC transporter substrate-binding protein [Xanthomonadales bacterium]|nr:molybdate ABC transporter substrate-binding protein [Xanthomonadales bacterium]
MKRWWHRCGVLVLCLSGMAALFASDASADDLQVAAAASLQGVLDELLERWAEQSPTPATRVSYGGSQILARQLHAGAPYALYLPADRRWLLQALAWAGAEANSATELASNRLVVIAPRGRCPAGDLLDPAVLERQLAGSRLAIGEPGSVPAGRYAEAALRHLRLWPVVEARLAPVENVRLALLLVARGEAPLGIVYATDAHSEPRVQRCLTLPANSHPPIRYAGMVGPSGDVEMARRLLAFLADSAQREIWQRHGFLPPTAN